MKKIGTLFIGLIMSTIAFAQTCTLDPSVTTVGLHPSVLVDGIISATYDQSVTIVFPTDTLGYGINRVKITNVELPDGLSWVGLTADSTFNPQVSSQTCIRITGTPTTIGDYTFKIDFSFGTSLFSGLSYHMEAPFTITPSVTSIVNDGYSTNLSSGCAPLSVNFMNNNPDMSGVQWDFGNGERFWGLDPETMVFDTPGEYPVKYMAYANHDTTYTYKLKQFKLTYANPSIWQAWYESTPDFKLRIYEDGVKIHETSLITQRLPTTFNLNIDLDPSKTYRIDCIEIDGVESLPISTITVGQHVLPVPFQETGTSTLPNVSTADYIIEKTQHNPVATLVVEDTIRVYENVGVPEITNTAGTLSVNEVGATNYTWYLNDVEIANVNTSTYTATASGNYKVEVNNEHCSEMSAVKTVAVCLANYVPEVVYLGSNQVTISNPLPNHTYQWSSANAPIAGAVNQVLNITNSGNFSISVTDQWGCNYTSSGFNAYLAVKQLDVNSIIAYPNPTSGKVTFSAQEVITNITVMDASGRIVLDIKNDTSSTTVNLDQYPTGYYMVNIKTQAGSINKKIIKQ